MSSFGSNNPFTTPAKPAQPAAVRDAPLSTLKEFLTLVKTKALARVNRYAVGFPIPKGLAGKWTPQGELSGVANVSMLCDEASIPGKQIMARSLRINALSEPRPHTMDFWNDTASFSFLIDNDWTARRFFEDWMTLCIGTGDSPRGLEIGDYDEYAAEVMIYSLAPGFDVGKNAAALERGGKTEIETPDQMLWATRLVEAWPRSIIIMPLSYGNTTIHRMVVTFMYKRWESLDANGQNREIHVGSSSATTTNDDWVNGGSLGRDTKKQLEKEKSQFEKLLGGFDSTMKDINSAINDQKEKIDPYLSGIDQVRDRFTIVKKKVSIFTGR